MSGIPEEYLNQIVTGDARELSKRLPDGCVDLVFTDPVYDRLDDYRWLAETAVRVLKPGGNLLAWQTPRRLPEALGAIAGPLFYRHTLCLTHSNACVGTITPNAYNHWTALVWASKTDRQPPNTRPRDTLDEPLLAGATANHRWHKSRRPVAYWLECFSAPGAVIFDPFTGGGTVPAVCKQLGRNYVAFEIDPATAERARERVKNTPMPLFVEEPEPLTLPLEMVA